MPIERKYERDIDLLLAEELVVNPAFATWMAEAAGLSAPAGNIVDIWVSKADNLGESDLIALYENSDGVRTALMIEDKVDAPLQPSQAARYRQRGDREIAAGLCGHARVILCAPASYIDGCAASTDFDATVSFERIAAFLRADDTDSRGAYRAGFLETAARRRANSWQRESDPQTNSFWQAAYELASREFPVLEMKPLKVTKGSSWIEFRPRDMPTLPKRTYLSVKCDRGQMDLTFSNTRVTPFVERVAPLLEPDMTVHQTTASTAIRLTVPGFRPDHPLAEALPKARDAFAACARLIGFYRLNRDALDDAARRATP